MKVSYFEKTDSAIFTFREGADYDESEEIFEGFVVDFDKSGRPMGLDVYQDASKFFDRDWLKKHADTPVKASMIRDAPPRKDK
ncbi:MAG TPA: DUF2283 domain-containing protein [Vicinamibacterales bacterium]